MPGGGQRPRRAPNQSGSAITTYWAEDAADLARRLGTGPEGLSGEEATRRLAEHGFNELQSARRLSRLDIAARQLRSPLLLLLVRPTRSSSMRRLFRERRRADRRKFPGSEETGDLGALGVSIELIRNRPGRLLLVLTMVLIPIAFAIPYLPFASVIGLVPMPGAIVAALVAIVLLYVGATEGQKRWFYRTAV